MARKHSRLFSGEQNSDSEFDKLLFEFLIVDEEESDGLAPSYVFSWMRSILAAFYRASP